MKDSNNDYAILKEIKDNNFLLSHVSIDDLYEIYEVIQNFKQF